MENAENAVVVNTLVVRGCEAVPVSVRATASPCGVPGIAIDGIGDTSWVDMSVKVRCALRAAGFQVPRQRLKIEISPAVRGKTVHGLELPVAAAILAASGQVPHSVVDGRPLVGELSLEGKVLPSEGIRLFQTQTSKDTGLIASRECDGKVLPSSLGAAEVFGIADLGDLRHGSSALEKCSAEEMTDPLGGPTEADFAEDAARAVEVACAGGHNLLFKGEDEESLMAAARSVAACMSAPADVEATAIAAMTSIGPRVARRVPLGTRPTAFWDARTDRLTDLIGGGRPVRPGAVSMASGGVLVIGHIDEMSDVGSQMLAQAMRDRSIRVVRADGAYRMPASTMVIGCMGPEGRLPEALRGFAFACADIGPRPATGHGVPGADIRRSVEAARCYAQNGAGRLSALSADPEDLIARTIADLAESPDVAVDHQREAHRITREATGRLFIYRVPAREPAPSLEALSLDKAVEAGAGVETPCAVRAGDAR